MDVVELSTCSCKFHPTTYAKLPAVPSSEDTSIPTVFKPSMIVRGSESVPEAVTVSSILITADLISEVGVIVIDVVPVSRKTEVA